MNDLINRQEAIDALNEYFARIGKLKRRGLTKGEKAISLDAVGTIKTLPSAQPYTDEEIQKMQEIEQAQIQKAFALGREEALSEIIRCKDCEYGKQDEAGRWFCRSFGCQIGNEDGSGYCADAERRTDDVDVNN